MCASQVLSGPERSPFEGNKDAFIEEIRQALYASKIISYAQGFMLLREAAKVFNWKLVCFNLAKKDTRHIANEHVIRIISL